MRRATDWKRWRKGGRRIRKTGRQKNRRRKRRRISEETGRLCDEQRDEEEKCED